MKNQIFGGFIGNLVGCRRRKPLTHSCTTSQRAGGGPRRPLSRCPRFQDTAFFANALDSLRAAPAVQRVGRAGRRAGGKHATCPQPDFPPAAPAAGGAADGVSAALLKETPAAQAFPRARSSVPTPVPTLSMRETPGNTGLLEIMPDATGRGRRAVHVSSMSRRGLRWYATPGHAPGAKFSPWTDNSRLHRVSAGAEPRDFCQLSRVFYGL
jgi:hypothetical protein